MQYFKIPKKLKLHVKLNLLKLKKFHQNFVFQGKSYHYFYHLYNNAWENERSVEIPIILETLKKYQRKQVLEVGNVLSHYSPVKHDILDKYERGKNIINQDVVSYHPQKKYDLIISISTLEHVGWDESPRRPHKILQSIENLKNILSSEGKILLTFPLGYNKSVDKLFHDGKLKFTHNYFLKKISDNNQWHETKIDDMKNIFYNYPFRGANVIIIGIIEKTYIAS